jgi:hypothetical protein
LEDFEEKSQCFAVYFPAETPLIKDHLEIAFNTIAQIETL